MYICIKRCEYIYCHPQKDCSVLSEVFSVAGQTGRSKPGSKHVQLYVRLSFRPLGHQADNVYIYIYIYICINKCEYLLIYFIYIETGIYIIYM